jgi:PhnB protein
MKDSVSLNVYMFFPRNSREAMEFYKDVFGGELDTTTRGSVDPEAPEDMKELLIHANLEGGLVHLMGADNTDTEIGPQDRIAISLNGTSEDEETLRKVYDDLAVGGKADHPLKKEFWGDTFGGLTDKFGISWLINIQAKKD